MTPEKVPSLFPQRPIRPLPKRKLREKLSPAAIETIEYPPTAVDNIPLFYYPTHSAAGQPNDATKSSKEPHLPASGTSNNLQPSDVSRHDHAAVAFLAERLPQPSSREDAQYHIPHQRASPRPNISTTLSIDGYDSPENTNNKKKRKIPSASDSTLRGSSFTSSEPVEVLELASGMDDDNQANTSAYDVSGPISIQNDGISGPGRGRLGRSAHKRSPLRTISDGNNTWPSRPMKPGRQQPGTSHGPSGIISNAIASAERLAPAGQENAGGLLQKLSDSERTTPLASQFTFTCGSQVAGTTSWPDTSPATSGADRPPPEHPGQCDSSTAEAELHGRVGGEGRRRPRINSRHQLERELMWAARERRQSAEEAYHRNPPSAEDIWICEFCEYERIFGTPPKALIREYEMKDRRNRQEEADRRRLLEKAKAKSRKGRRSNKGNKGTASATQSPNQMSDGQAVAEAPPMEPSHSHSTQSEDDYEDRVNDYRTRDPPDILGLYERQVPIAGS